MYSTTNKNVVTQVRKSCTDGLQWEMMPCVQLVERFRMCTRGLRSCRTLLYLSDIEQLV